MVKEWNSCHSQYLQSYHIEVLALNVFNTHISDLGLAIHTFFDSGLALLKSPLAYNDGVADEYLSRSDRAEAVKRFETAKTASLMGWYYGTQGKDEDAIAEWKKLFCDKFPAYR